MYEYVHLDGVLDAMTEEEQEQLKVYLGHRAIIATEPTVKKSATTHKHRWYFLIEPVQISDDPSWVLKQVFDDEYDDPV